jgi:hypothetical protein
MENGVAYSWQGGMIRKRLLSESTDRTTCVKTERTDVRIASMEVVLATWDIRSENRHLKSDMLVPLCLQERDGKGRIREYSCILYLSTFLSLRKGEACVPCSHPYQATNSSLPSRAPRWYGSLDETALHLPSAWNASRPCESERFISATFNVSAHILPEMHRDAMEKMDTFLRRAREGGVI